MTTTPQTNPSFSEESRKITLKLVRKAFAHARDDRNFNISSNELEDAVQALQALHDRLVEVARQEFPQWIKDNCSMSIHEMAPRHNAYTVYESDVEAQLTTKEDKTNETNN